MKNFLNAIYNLFSRKGISLYIIFFCIAAKSILIIFYSYIGRDKIYSLSAGYNLIHGKGWTNSFYYLNDLDKEILQPFCHWPMGYGLLTTPFQKVFGTNLFLSTTLFEILCFGFFILLCRNILKIMGLSLAWLNISTILLSFFSHDFIERSLGTDLLALDFILGFFYCSIRLWSNVDTRLALRLGLVSGTCLFFAGFTRYHYVPVAMFMVLALWLISYWKRNRVAMKGYFFAVLICFSGLIAAMLFQQSACGSPFYTGIDKKGIFIENLGYWHPSVIAAFVNLDMVPVQFEKYSSISYSSWMELLNWINLFFYLCLVIAFCIFFYRKRNSSRGDFPIFIISGTLLSAAIIGGLALLSLTHSPKYTLAGEAWTFIVEGRYYAFSVVFLQLLFLTVVAKRNDLFAGRKVAKGLVFFLSLLFFLNAAHQMYYTTKVALTYKTMKTAVVREQDYVYFESLLVSTIKENPGRDVLVASSDSYYPLLASMHNQKGIADPYSLDSRVPIVRKPAVLFTVVTAPEKKRYINYLNNKEVRFVKEVAGIKIYKQLLEPSHKSNQ